MVDKKTDDKDKTTDDGTKKDLDLTNNPLIKEIQKSLAGLVVIVQEGQRASKQVEQSVSALTNKLSDGINKKETKDEKIADEDVDNMSNSQLIGLISKEVGSILDDRLKKTDERIEGTSKAITDDKLEREINELKDNHKDLFDWKTEIKTMAEQHPDLSPTRLYQLVRAENPDKAKELDTKYDETKDGKKDGDGKPTMYGLTPTSSTTADEKPEKMNPDDAVKKAFEETLEEFPGMANLTGEAGNV